MANRPQMRPFWERWQIQPSETEEFEKTIVRISQIVETQVWSNTYRSPELFRELAVLRGVRFDGSDVGYPNMGNTSLGYVISKSNDLAQLAMGLQFILWAVASVKPDLLDRFVDSINNVLALSPNILLHVAKSGDGATVYPGGAGLLDEVLIDENLEWLEAHQSASKGFQQALVIYLSKDVDKYRNLLDNLRFAVEQLLRDVLGNQKSLENQKDALLPWLRSKGLHPQVINMYHELLFKHFALYQNDAVKHGEGYAIEEIEFMIYLTGTFMRLLIQVSGQPSAAKQ